MFEMTLRHAPAPSSRLSCGSLELDDVDRAFFARAVFHSEDEDGIKRIKFEGERGRSLSQVKVVLS